MKRLIFILLILTACTKPDETVFEPTPDLVCVDCVDQLSHLAFLDAFCGTDKEADRFISEAKEAAMNNGIYLHCLKHK